MFVFLIFSLILLSLASNENEVRNTKRRLLDNVLERSLKGKNAAVSIVWKDFQYAKGFGTSKISNDKPISPVLSLFPLGRVSQIFTTISILQLYETKRLDLDDNIKKYVDLSCKNLFKNEMISDCGSQNVTIRSLLSHTSGLEFKKERYNPYLSMISSNLTDILSKSPCIIFKPQTTFSINDYNHAILALIVSKVSGKPFTQYVHEKVLTPLGMFDTAFAVEEEEKKIFKKFGNDSLKALHHFSFPKSHSSKRNWSFSHLFSSTGAYSTGKDMLKLLIALQSKGVGPPDEEYLYGTAPKRILEESTFTTLESEQFVFSDSFSALGILGKNFQRQQILYLQDSNLHSKTMLALLSQKKFAIFITHDIKDGAFNWDTVQDLVTDLFPSEELKAEELVQNYVEFNGVFHSVNKPLTGYEFISGLNQQISIRQSKFSIPTKLLKTSAQFRPLIGQEFTLKSVSKDTMVIGEWDSNKLLQKFITSPIVGVFNLQDHLVSNTNSSKKMLTFEMLHYPSSFIQVDSHRDFFWIFSFSLLSLLVFIIHLSIAGSWLHEFKSVELFSESFVVLVSLVSTFVHLLPFLGIGLVSGGFLDFYQYPLEFKLDYLVSNFPLVSQATLLTFGTFLLVFSINKRVEKRLFWLWIVFAGNALVCVLIK